MLIAALVLGIIGALFVFVSSITCGLCTALVGLETGETALVVAGVLMLVAAVMAIVGAALSIPKGGAAGAVMLISFLMNLAGIIVFSVFFTNELGVNSFGAGFVLNIVGFIGSIFVLIASFLAFAGRGQKAEN